MPLSNPSTIYSLPRVYKNTSPAVGSPLRLRLRSGEATGRHDGESAAPKPFRQGTLTVTPVLDVSATGSERRAPFGAEVEGVDWTQPVSDEVVEQVRRDNELLPLRTRWHDKNHGFAFECPFFQIL